MRETALSDCHRKPPVRLPRLTLLPRLALLPLLALPVLAGCQPDRRHDHGHDHDHDHGHEPARAPADEPPPEAPATGASRLRTVYVPAYSHLPKRGTQRTLLSILLSVRNVDSSAVVTLTHVDYYDTSGHRVRRYLRKPRRLRPLETAEFSVDVLDEAGGSGANFLVYWEGPAGAHPLLTEAVMVGHLGAGYVGFTSRGVELDRRPDLSRVEAEPDPGSQPRSDAGIAAPPMAPPPTPAP